MKKDIKVMKSEAQEMLDDLFSAGQIPFELSARLRAEQLFLDRVRLFFYLVARYTDRLKYGDQYTTE